MMQRISLIFKAPVLQGRNNSEASSAERWLQNGPLRWLRLEILYFNARSFKPLNWLHMWIRL